MNPKTESDLLLNLKDINKFTSKTAKIKIEDQKLTVDKGLEKYNQSLTKALEAPIPNINLPYNEVLVRACPVEIKSRGGIILSVGDSAIDIAGKLNVMSEALDPIQEILMVGAMVSKEERDGGIRPGLKARINLNHMKRLNDDHGPGLIQAGIDFPTHTIQGYKYMIINKRDILYTL